MSGGHFNYDQYKIIDIAVEIDSLIKNNDSQETDEWGYSKGHGYSKETIDKFKDAVYHLRMAYVYACRVDWLVSGDDSEESFHERLKEELGKLDGDK